MNLGWERGNVPLIFEFVIMDADFETGGLIGAPDPLAVCGKTWKLKLFSLLRVIAFGVFGHSRRFLVV